jgi:hypothetical protein
MKRSARKPSPVHLSRRLAVGLVAVLALAGWACTSTSQAQFTCDARINDGLLLAIDLIEVTDDEVKQIQDAGEDWFTSPARDQLRNRIKTISVPGGCSETVELASLTSSEKFLKKKKGYGTLAVIAEFQTISGDTAQSNMVFRPRGQWKGKTTSFRVHEDYLSVEGSR